ncbi:hypothetical protein GDO78_008611 [Eleutherodactylus coqui]|uniref:Uncharacterized protein n=1 Tax=Eleutherodactylus coqui TaxID=57060 RepID=A0A8J6K9D8_ELECQ|nr:hypothetical protein GDO78_008611 [Eleutherodactylus coqui]
MTRDQHLSPPATLYKVLWMPLFLVVSEQPLKLCLLISKSLFSCDYICSVISRTASAWNIWNDRNNSGLIQDF